MSEKKVQDLKKDVFENENVNLNEIKFSKEQIINSEKFRSISDVLNAILLENDFLTLVEVGKKINKFMKGKV